MIVSSNVAAYLKPSCVPTVHALFATRLCARVCVPMHTRRHSAAERKLNVKHKFYCSYYWCTF